MKKPKNSKKEAAPANPQVTTDNKDTKKPVRFVVVRDGYRVSDKEYESASDEAAIQECGFWTRVAQNHSYGEPVGIVPFEPKKHRVW